MTETTAHDGDFDILTDDLGPWAPGDVITCLIAGSTANFGVPGSGGQTYRRGDRIVVARDSLRFQGALLALVDDPAAQLRRWGQQKFARGVVDLERWEQRGDAEWLIARDSARNVANQVPDPAERAIAQREVTKRFGRTPTSTSTDNRVAQSYEARQSAQEDYDKRQRGERHYVTSLAE